MLGRPTVVIPLSHRTINENERIPLSMISTLKKLKSGYLNGTRVVLGTIEEFLSTSCIASLGFLSNTEEGDPEGLNDSVKDFLERELKKPFVRKVSHQPTAKRKISIRSRKSGVSGIIKRTRSIQVDQYDPGIAHSKYHSNKLTKILLQTPLHSPDLNQLRSAYHESRATHSHGSEHSSHPSSNHSSPLHDSISPIFNCPPPTEDMDISGGHSFDQRYDTNRTEKRLKSMSHMNINEDIKEEELLTMYREAEMLEEQADILHYLCFNK